MTPAARLADRVTARFTTAARTGVTSLGTWWVSVDLDAALHRTRARPLRCLWVVTAPGPYGPFDVSLWAVPPHQRSADTFELRLQVALELLGRTPDPPPLPSWDELAAHAARLHARMATPLDPAGDLVGP